MLQNVAISKKQISQNCLSQLHSMPLQIIVILHGIIPVVLCMADNEANPHHLERDNRRAIIEPILLSALEVRTLRNSPTPRYPPNY
jgi:hypothetical protein